MIKKLVFLGSGKYRTFDNTFDHKNKFEYEIIKNQETTVFIKRENLQDFLDTQKYMPIIRLRKNNDYWFNLRYLNKPINSIVKSKLSDIYPFETIKKLKIKYVDVLFAKIRTINLAEKTVGLEDKSLIMYNYYIRDIFTLKYDKFNQLLQNKCYIFLIDINNKNVVDVFCNISDNKILSSKQDREIFLDNEEEI